MTKNGFIIIVGFHVDDILCISQCQSIIDDLLLYLRENFEEVSTNINCNLSYLGMMIDTRVCMNG
jgi:hypothetical protein